MKSLLLVLIGTSLAFATESSFAAEPPATATTTTGVTAPMLDFGNPCHAEIVDSKQAVTKPPRSRGKWPAPDYPPFARRMGQEGTVWLLVFVTDEGKVGQVQVKTSSGWPRLDDAAMNGVREWEFIPGQTEGQPGCMWVTVPLIFKLTEYSAAELSAANVSRESDSLAQLLLGDKSLQDILTRSSKKQKGSGVDEQVAGQLVAILSARKEWQDSLHDLSAMLAIEFSPAELAELERLIKSPVMQKYSGLQHKLQPEIQRSQQRFGATLYCVTSIMRQAAGINDMDDDALNMLPEGIVQATPKIAKQLESYCDCIANSLTATRNPRVANETCGVPPKISW